jgi:hypothetical protein
MNEKFWKSLSDNTINQCKHVMFQDVEAQVVANI